MVSQGALDSFLETQKTLGQQQHSRKDIVSR